MRLAISNIAWDVAEDKEIAQLLHRYGIDAIDIAPGKYFPDPIQATAQDIAKVKTWWAECGVEITGIQALVFGTTGLNVFGSIEVQNAMLAHLSIICRIGGALGARWLVFGSPKNRDRSGLNDQQTMDIAVDFFRRLGNIAESHRVIVCLEPNPPCYGANFMVTSTETARVVNFIDHPAIRMQLDTGTLTINGENVANVLGDYAQLIGHIHASERDLLPLGDGETNHGKICKAIEHYLPGYVVSIEMVATKNEPHVVSIERALNTAVQNYRLPNESSR
uniref:Sugar phosphate isomerase/epimerase n=1 Tax=Candidatus Kentrum sp. LFY TaxID=2126342 RepID=A0A450V277_9GAMM|nr:MAG: Sugar phosphate isomerase/epimerase [Candidatus Kentron sp. LFY]